MASAATAMKEDPASQWDASQFSMDRFGMGVKETPAGGLMSSMGGKLLGMFTGALSPTRPSAQCQADGCTADMTKMRDYHSRYKICETHLKASVVIKDGRPQRFCQQCGKFQDVADFDGEKRSCRARLDKHNTRRRRQREIQHMLRTTGRIDEAALAAKYGMTEEELAPKIQRIQKQMRMSNNTSTTSASGGSSGAVAPTHSGASGGGVVSQQTRAVASGMGPGGMPDFVGIPPADLGLLGDMYLEDVMGPAGLAATAASAQAVAAAAAPAVMDLDDMTVLEELTREFGFNPNTAALAAASSVHAAASMTPFGAPAAQQTHANAFVSPFANAQQAASFPFLTSTAAAPALPPWAVPAGSTASLGGASARTVTTGMSGLPPYMQPTPQAPSTGGPPSLQVRSSTSSDTTSPSVFEDALKLLNYNQDAVQYTADDRLVRLSTKLFGCTPADLPADLKTSLQDMLKVDSGMEAYMRPGCVHVEVNAMVEGGADGTGAGIAADGPAAMHAAVERFLAGPSGAAATAAAHTVVLQLGDKLAMVKDGKLVHVVDTAGAARLMPSLSAVRPLAVVPPPRGGSVTLSVWGYNLGREGDVVLARSRGRHLETEIVTVDEPLAEWEGLQRMEIRVKGPLDPGALQVEVMRGAYASAARSVLVAPSAEIAAEVATLEATPDVGSVDTLVYELGAVVEAAGASTAAAAVLAAGPAPPAKAASRLLPFTVQRKWPALTRTVLNVAQLYARPSDAMAAADVIAVGTIGMPLLQLAVRTQSADMVSLLLSWARSARHEFRSTTPGRRGLTALHLAALVHDGGLIAALLTAGCPDALEGWDGARAEDGSSPLALATRHGTSADLERVIAQALHAQMRSKGGIPSPTVSSPSFAMASSSKGGLSIERLPSEIDDVALAKAAHRGATLAREAASGPLLTFASPALEAKYTRWYHAGQVPVDIAFMMITILSQAAWVLRWNMASSLVLGIAMLGLICLNASYLAMATLRPAIYIANREKLCVVTLLVHKVVQLLVTAMPGVGTIYSPTYNTTVALLESSSFAQIAMLSFGAKARIAYHLPALVAALGLSSTINGPICSAAFPGAPLLACRSGLFAFQALACCALPAAAVYLSEKRSRRIFLETAVS